MGLRFNPCESSVSMVSESIMFMEEGKRFRGVKSVRGRDLERGRCCM
ncbi:hypothetical protein COLO4_21804 [Corchorus olitorius]|uniref:Uncharacterized protein n=1 Tax=Corchorus olitorius TaxID=93759 RepID=A0A1R3IQL4_9ROSI|nr:hypothetical protein COLO4_21804 [Corchorus olitorius]